MNEFFLLTKKHGNIEKDSKTLVKDEKSKSFSDFSKVLRDYNKEPLNKSQIYMNKEMNAPIISKQPSELYEKIYLSSWGLSNFGQTGVLPQSAKSSSINLLESFTTPFDISCGENHSAIINQKLKLFMFGNNVFGQLGIPEQPVLYRPQLVPYLKDKQITMISCGSDHTFAITTQNEVYSWGLNLKGQLGLGDYENRFTPSIVVPLLPKGFNNNNISVSKDIAIKRQKSSNDLLNKSDGLPDIPNKKAIESLSLLQQDEYIVEISCGTLHTLAKSNFNRVFSTGFGETYALGHGDQSTLSDFRMIINLLKNKPIGKSNYEIEKIVSGFSHSACLCNGRVYMWGVVGSQENRVYKTPTLIEYCVDSNKKRVEFKDIIDIKLGEMFSIFLNSKGEVYGFGDNNESQLGLKENNLYEFPQKIDGIRETIGAISCGKKHSLAISLDRKTVYGWGSNVYHQLDINNEKLWPNPQRIPHLKQSECIRVICGSYHTFSMSYNSPFNENASPNNNNAFNRDYSKNFDVKNTLEKDYQKILIENENLKKEKEKLEQKIILQQSELDQLKMEFRRKKSENNINIKPSGKSPAFDPEKPLPTPREFTPNYEIEYNELVFGSQISEGGYGKIYKGRWRETEVAIKMLKMEGASENHVRDFLSECKVMEVLRHPNIVLFLGACIKPPNLGIVLEFCSKGSLWSVLQNHNIDLTWEDRRKIALDTAKGVFYLHSFNPPILHRDLKSLNLLLDDSLRTKLIDFGWTRKLDIKMTGKIGTYQWMAPEVISSQMYTEKADVFSFGIILWEIASREPPYRHISGLQVSIEVVNNDLRPTIPKKTPDGWAKLMKRCWDRDPQRRPSFKEIIKELEFIKF